MIAALWAMATIAKFLWPLPDRGMHKRLNRVRAETLVAWPEWDGVVSPEYAGELFGSPDFPVPCRGAAWRGHVPQLERLNVVGPMVSDLLGR
jgi:hypothetical protein